MFTGCLTSVATVLYGVKYYNEGLGFDDLPPLHWGYLLGCASGLVFIGNGIHLAVRSRGDMTPQHQCCCCCRCDTQPARNRPGRQPAAPACVYTDRPAPSAYMYTDQPAAPTAVYITQPAAPAYTGQPTAPAYTGQPAAPTYTDPAYTGRSGRDDVKLIN